MHSNDMKEALRDAAAGRMQDRLMQTTPRHGVTDLPDFDEMPAAALKQALLHFVEKEAGMVKGMAAGNGKKDLAREVVHLRGVVKTLKRAISQVRTDGHAFGHAEAFMLMHYRLAETQDKGDGVAPAEDLFIWNSRDGVTPFIVHIGGAKYEHAIGAMKGPFFDLPQDQSPTHVWVTRTDGEVLEAWHRTVDAAVSLGRFTQERADRVRDDLGAAKSWNYHIGLRDLATGRFTDEAVLAHAVQKAEESSDE